MPSQEIDERILNELQDIKRLLILRLLDSGFQASSLADVIGMDRADFSRLFPVKKLLIQKK